MGHFYRFGVEGGMEENERGDTWQPDVFLSGGESVGNRMSLLEVLASDRLIVITEL